MLEVAEPFDRAARRRARDRAAPGFSRHAFLKETLAAELAGRLQELGIRPGRALDLGAHDGALRRLLPAEELVAADAGFRFARAAAGVMCDEDRLPFADASFDAVVSAGSLHGVNDLPGALVQVRRLLRPGGVFLANFVGGASLAALRSRLVEAEEAVCGGVSPRLLPMVDAREAPSLLQRAGFAAPVVDVVALAVRYPSARAMLDDLRGTGECNILAARSRRPLSRTLAAALLAAAEAVPDSDGRYPVDLEIVTLTGRVR
jgi:NADH dehydrogenase [ubiquinone] 1 alpha subcomplex assembly factor 5